MMTLAEVQEEFVTEKRLNALEVLEEETDSGIVISGELVELIEKLSRCCDSKTGMQSFMGAVRLDFLDGVPTFQVEETVWETESGDRLDTRAMRL